ncbi:hypothetical protein BDD12DRAFT_979401 [Trichophaea hybrida]|nr:hypothetical protein BDD12DRAFT_979401 [Trichophaea hybrida]
MSPPPLIILISVVLLIRDRKLYVFLRGLSQSWDNISRAGKCYQTSWLDSLLRSNFVKAWSTRDLDQIKGCDDDIVVMKSIFNPVWTAVNMENVYEAIFDSLKTSTTDNKMLKWTPILSKKRTLNLGDVIRKHNRWFDRNTLPDDDILWAVDVATAENLSSEVNQ